MSLFDTLQAKHV